jgi:hypothetical protein
LALAPWRAPYASREVELESLVIIAAVGAVGVAAIAATLAWPIYIKPKLRRRYERNHHRAKIAARRPSSPNAK